MYFGANPPKAHSDHVKAEGDRRRIRENENFAMAMARDDYGSVPRINDKGRFVPVNGVLPPGMVVSEKVAHKMTQKRIKQ